MFNAFVDAVNVAMSLSHSGICVNGPVCVSCVSCVSCDRMTLANHSPSDDVGALCVPP